MSTAGTPQQAWVRAVSDCAADACLGDQTEDASGTLRLRNPTETTKTFLVAWSSRTAVDDTVTFAFQPLPPGAVCAQAPQLRDGETVRIDAIGLQGTGPVCERSTTASAAYFATVVLPPHQRLAVSVPAYGWIPAVATDCSELTCPTAGLSDGESRTQFHTNDTDATQTLRVAALWPLAGSEGTGWLRVRITGIPPESACATAPPLVLDDTANVLAGDVEAGTAMVCEGATTSAAFHRVDVPPGSWVGLQVLLGSSSTAAWLGDCGALHCLEHSASGRLAWVVANPGSRAEHPILATSSLWADWSRGTSLVRARVHSYPPQNVCAQALPVQDGTMLSGLWLHDAWEPAGACETGSRPAQWFRTRVPQGQQLDVEALAEGFAIPPRLVLVRACDAPACDADGGEPTASTYTTRVTYRNFGSVPIDLWIAAVSGTPWLDGPDPDARFDLHVTVRP